MDTATTLHMKIANHAKAEADALLADRMSDPEAAERNRKTQRRLSADAWRLGRDEMEFALSGDGVSDEVTSFVLDHPSIWPTGWTADGAEQERAGR